MRKKTARPLERHRAAEDAIQLLVPTCEAKVHTKTMADQLGRQNPESMPKQPENRRPTKGCNRWQLQPEAEGIEPCASPTWKES